MQDNQPQSPPPEVPTPQPDIDVPAPPAEIPPRDPAHDQPTDPTKLSEEIGGAKGPEPTRYGDWQHRGRCTDF
jgi:homeobox protein ESX1